MISHDGWTWTVTPEDDYPASTVTVTIDAGGANGDVTGRITSALVEDGGWAAIAWLCGEVTAVATAELKRLHGRAPSGPLHALD